MSRSAELLALVKRERKREHELSWADAEEHVGFEFPGDYKELLSAVGSGTFDHVVEVTSPVADEDSLDGFFGDVHESREFDGLIPWGRAGSCTLFWRTDGKPDEWTIALCDAEFSEWESYDGPMTAFLHDLLTGKFTTALVEFTPGRDPGFWPG
ncbi:SMI1/KNR4 family protein [Lentzea sp. NPDC059081]|uniref:SMI1/KNR4 family protein n=1 Tax=Lentzea sp. NPDC059081 TaxID=3346719 RepID=UPI0036ABBF4D